MRRCAWLALPAVLVPLLTACRRELIKPNDEPATVVTKAELALTQDFRHRCQTENSGNSGPGTHVLVLFEVAAPYQFRIATEEKTDGQPTQRREIIMIKDEAYLREGDQTWQKSPEWAGYFRKLTGGPPMVASSGLDRWEGTGLKFAGQDVIDGEPTLRYDATIDDHVGMVKTIKYWIGVYDGLPHKTEEALTTKVWGSAPIRSHTETRCTFSGHVAISSPI
jgi:hypothetical protein